MTSAGRGRSSSMTRLASAALLLLALSLTSSVTAQDAQVQRKEKAALIAIRNALPAQTRPAGASKPNWWRSNNWKTVNTSMPCTSDWLGVVCKEGRVIRLEMSSKITGDAILKGQMPWGDLGALEKLEYMNFSDQAIAGEAVPSSTPSSLTALTHLSLAGNSLSSLAESVSILTSLQALDLGYNPSMIGLVPTGLSLLNSLTALSLSHTNLSQPQPWPPPIASLLNLAVLKLDVAGLSGPLPDSYSVFTSLGVMNLSSSSIGSPIPESWISLVRLANLDLSNCGITGGLPSFLANVSETLLLNNNSLGGDVPLALWQSKARIDLSNNYLRGDIPNPNNIALIGDNCFTTTAPPQKDNATCSAYYANFPLPPPPPSGGGPNIGLIVGLSVAGGVLLLALIGFLVWFFVFRRRQGDDEDEDEYDDEDGDGRPDDDEDEDEDDDDDDNKNR